jgi:hypothetical protein
MRADDDGLGGVHLGRAAGRHPAAADRRQDQYAVAPAHKGQASWFVNSTVPEADPHGVEGAGHGARIGADQAELADTEELGGAERLARGRLLPKLVVGDQFDDVAAWVMRIAGLGVPGLKREYRRAGLMIDKQLSMTREPIAAGRKAVAWDT